MLIEGGLALGYRSNVGADHSGATAPDSHRLPCFVFRKLSMGYERNTVKSNAPKAILFAGGVGYLDRFRCLVR
jgi:hypothetical protein